MLVRLWSKAFKLGFQQYMNQDLLDVQAGFRKGRGIRNQTANICWIIEKVRESQKASASLAIRKPLTVWITTDCGKFLETGVPDHLTCPLRNLYAGQEATVTMLHSFLLLSKISFYKYHIGLKIF